MSKPLLDAEWFATTLDNTHCSFRDKIIISGLWALEGVACSLVCTWRELASEPWKVPHVAHIGWPRPPMVPGKVPGSPGGTLNRDLGVWAYKVTLVVHVQVRNELWGPCISKATILSYLDLLSGLKQWMAYQMYMEDMVVLWCLYKTLDTIAEDGGQIAQERE